MKTFVVLAVVFIASIATGLLADPNGAVRALSHYPALVALLGIVWKVLQYEIEDQRAIRKAEILSLNSLFAGSHYAAKIYDRQIDFCEQYWAITLEILEKLNRETSTPSVVDDANRLYRYRMEKAIWLTEDMNLSLEGFEKALRSVGIDSHRLEHLPVGEQRSQVVERETARFLEIIDAERQSEESEGAISYTTVLEKLKEVLGIAEAYTFRRRFMGTAETLNQKAERTP